MKCNSSSAKMTNHNLETMLCNHREATLELLAIMRLAQQPSLSSHFSFADTPPRICPSLDIEAKALSSDFLANPHPTREYQFYTRQKHSKMSFGFGVGDFLAFIKLATELRQAYLDAPGHVKAISDELQSLTVLLQVVEYLQKCALE